MTPSERTEVLDALVSDEVIDAVAAQMQNECFGWFEDRPEAGLFDWRVAALNALAVARKKLADV